MEFKIERPQDQKTQELVDLALAARNNSYSPYSKFRVGAAIRTADGKIFQGCNIESCSYAPTICAERVAISNAVATGHKQFDTIAISSDLKEEFITPCGVCRQFMREFSKDLAILMVRPDGTFSRTDLTVLLPGSFGPESLEMPR
ncbi:cytidine deaminase complexed with cytidine [Kickxella alabastrina]|uniref:cytidine deaminase complexed with cytidine n=1 Tax=Kickxella alabastrina TaxID=61397 RepID=UPI00221FA47B|nr:cytidine deaminase complexed with cytidine [Kickxella alabastrina]KAI7834851.1 cytidine deaminase complexed with cytidine [Kickxella alabastrina]KAJ1947151.1 hypothetical protein GGF37_000672 [Kickxella alabastrina]